MITSSSHRPLVLSALTAAVAACLAVGAAVPAQAAANADPSYQIKLQLKGALVVDPSTGKPTAAATKALHLVDADDVQYTQYIDDAAHDLDGAGWSVRVRHDAGDDQLKLTYKARFDIDGVMTDKDNIEDALDDANDHNLDSSDTNYDAQVNMSYNRATLDFSVDKKEDTSLAEGELPDAAASASVLNANLPGKMEDLGDSKHWASDVVSHGHVYGPLKQTAYTAKVGGVDAELQITPMVGGTDGSGYYVEVSADADGFKDAIAARSALLSELTADGYLRPVDAFKTDLALANY